MAEPKHTLLAKFLLWRARHISKEQFILILSVLVGFFSGLVAVFLKNATHIIQEVVSSDHFFEFLNPWYFILPIVGILITVGIKRLTGKNIGEGIPSALFAMSRREGILKPYTMYASVITSMFTVGFGGSVGLEGPAVSTGAAIGSNFGRVMHINYRSRILLMSCASAGAIASIFNAPIAAIVFTIEIFSLDFTLSSLIPLLLSSISGAVTSMFLQSDASLFHSHIITEFQLLSLPFYVMLAAISALVSVYFNKVFFWFDDFFNSIGKKRLRILIGGSLLGVLVYLVPPLYGEGYGTVTSLLKGNINEIFDHGLLNHIQGHELIGLLVIASLVFLKAIATSLTMGAGGVGGVFAPSLFTGASLGFVFSRLLNTLNLAHLPETNFTLVGMAGLMAGVLHAPLTAVFMIAEITGGYDLIIPLMLVSAISYLVSRQFLSYSFYTRELIQKGDLLTHNKDQTVLTLLTVDKVVEKNFSKIRPNMTLRRLIEVVSSSPRNIFPVVDEHEHLVGILTLDDIRSFMFDKALYDALVVAELMSMPPAIIHLHDPMSVVMKKFQQTGAWNLPVVDEDRYIGFISKSKLFSAYRRKLIEFTA